MQQRSKYCEVRLTGAKQPKVNYLVQAMFLGIVSLICPLIGPD